MLLPLDMKHSWKGARTTGEIKRDNNIQNPANLDSMYTVRITLIISINLRPNVISFSL